MIADRAPNLLDYAEIIWRRRRPVAVFVALVLLTAAGALWLSPAPLEAEAIVALTPPAFAGRIALLVKWELGVPRVRVADKPEDFLVRLIAQGTTPAEDLDRALAWIVTQRRQPPTPVPLPPLPPSRQKTGVAEVSPEVPPAPAPLPPLPLKPPTDAEVSAWSRDLARLEATLPGLTASAALYWTGVAAELHGRLRAAQVTAREYAAAVQDRPRLEARARAELVAASSRRAAQAAQAAADEADRLRRESIRQEAVAARAEAERHNAMVRAWVPETVEVLWRSVPVSRPAPWFSVFAVAAVAALVLGVMWALGAEWLEWERRQRAEGRAGVFPGAGIGGFGPLPSGPARRIETGWVP